MCKDCGCTAQGDTLQTTISVRGLNILNSISIKRKLLGLPGVYHLHIHLLAGEIIIDFNPNFSPITDIIASLESSGLQLK